VLLFGTKKLRGLGGDFGRALKGFKRALSENDAQWNTDLDVAYQVTDNIKLTLGAHNIFDAYPKAAILK